MLEEVIDSIKEEVVEKIENTQNYYIVIGVISQYDKKRKDFIYTGVTNADLMYIHENGSPANNIPERPVLQMTLDYAKKSGELKKAYNKSLDKYLKTGNIEDFENEMNRFCMRLQSYARKIIYDNDGRLAPNAPSTIAKKGDNHPLFDTGQLARSIVCKLINNKENINL